jgi:hypothetical protein
LGWLKLERSLYYHPDTFLQNMPFLTPHKDILPSAQHELRPLLAYSVQLGFVLYGGTARSGIFKGLGAQASSYNGFCFTFDSERWF